MMRIAIDYDKTYTAYPEFWDDVLDVANKWDDVLDVANKWDVDVRIVTIRDERYDRTAPLIALEAILPVMYSAGAAKAFHCARENGIPDVVIDDAPQSWHANSTATPEWLKGWRAERGEPAA